MAQWWSIALPRRGSRVRIPSRALKKITKRMSLRISFLLFFESNPGLEVRMSSRRSGPCKTEVPRTSCTVSRSQEITKRMSLRISFLLFFESNPGLEVRMSPLRSGPCKTEVPQTSCTVSRLIEKYR